MRLRKKYFRKILFVKIIRAYLQCWVIAGVALSSSTLLRIEHNEIYLFEVKMVSLGQALEINNFYSPSTEAVCVPRRYH